MKNIKNKNDVIEIGLEAWGSTGTDTGATADVKIYANFDTCYRYFDENHLTY